MQLNLFNTVSFLLTAGYIGLFLMIFAETGLLVGLILPGESLLFTAGFLASQGYLNIGIIIFITFIAAVLADNAEYAVGRRFGSKIFQKKNSVIFNPAYIGKTEEFYKRHGPKAIIFARFVPFIRTLAPALAGVGKMEWSLFVLYNILGAMFWSFGIGLSGYFLGRALPNPERYVSVIVLLVLAVSLAPALVAIMRDRQRRLKVFSFLKKAFTE